MPTERPDWPDRQPPQVSPVAPGLVIGGVAEATLRVSGPAQPDLVVRTRRSDQRLKAGTSYRVGRDPEADIVVTDTRVSWQHGVLRLDGGTWVLEDAGSTNGTFLGPRRVGRVEITEDCVVRLGNPEDGPVLRCMPQAPAASRPPHAPHAPSEQPPSPPPPAAHSPAAHSPVAQPFAPQTPSPEPPAQMLRAQPPAASQHAAASPAPPQHQAPPKPPAAPPRKPGRPSPWLGQPDESTPAWADTRPKRDAPDAGSPAAPSNPAAPAAKAGPAAKAAKAGKAPGQPDLLPSVDRRPTARMPLPAKAMRIGRIPDNDLVLSDYEVSRHHAELRRSPSGTYEIVDLGSHNGTFVNGQQITAKTLTDHDIISIGRSTFRLADGELRQFVDDGQVTFAAQDLVVKVGGGKVLLDHVTFPVPEKCLLGVIGPSGAGKSTLLGALTGMRPADTGSVLYDNRDLYGNYDELRHRIGLVPQQSVLHTQLTARRALQYTAELRFPADIRSAERDTRVDEVMTELDLTKHAATRAERLSGGQLKRVNVAQELLTKPSLLFLDEPTSGLDPNLDKQVMEQMRDLAHDGRTVIVVTHSVAHLDMCDRLLVLFPGGKIAFYGPPTEGLSYFGLPGWAEVFEAFDRYPDRDWAGEFKASPAYAEYVIGQRPRQARPANTAELAAAQPVQPRSALRQLGTLIRRYLRVIAADRGYLISMLLLPLVLGVLIHFVGGSQGLAGLPHTNANASEVLLMLVICACLSGTASSVRELVKERTIFVRERAAGLSSGAYLSSKLFVLGAVSIVQSVLLVLLGLYGQKLPARGALLGMPLLEIGIGIAVLSIASMCLGLLISALVSTSEKAMPALVLLTMVQVILSGGVVSLMGKPGLEQLAYLAPARWGFGAVASSVNLNVIGAAGAGNTDPLWAQSAANWLRDMGLLVVLGAAFTLIAWLRMRRLGPRRRRKN